MTTMFRMAEGGGGTKAGEQPKQRSEDEARQRVRENGE